MIQTYRLAFDAFRKLFWMLIALSALFSVFNLLFQDGSSSIGSQIVVYGIIALISHRAILFGETPAWISKSGLNTTFLAFIWRYFVFLAVGAIVFGFCIYWLLQTTGAETEGEELAATFLALVPAVVAFMVFASAFGTVLPAAAVGGDARFGVAFKRGGFFRTFWRLLTGNILSALVVMAASVYAAITLPETPTISFIAQVLFETLGMLPILLTAAALSLACLEEGGEIPDQDARA